MAVINGSPFNFGRLVCAYSPLDGLRAQSGAAFYSTHGISILFQLPHFTLSPSLNESKELTVPFISPVYGIQIQSSDSNFSDFDDTGIMYIYPYSSLLSTNKTPADPVTVTFYTSFHDVVLGTTTPETFVGNGPTEDGKPKSSGLVSTIATNIRSVAARLTDVPLIGPYMKATEIGAGALASIATMFGYSKIKVPKPISLIRNINYGEMSLIAGQDDSLPLRLDPLGGLSISGVEFGLPDGDEMSIASIISRKGLLGVTLWQTTDVAGTCLMNYPVTPHLSALSAGSVTLTPLNHVSMCFEYWTGPLIYEIEIVASQFHRGRLAIRYTPYNYTPGTGELPNFSEPTTNTCILDISQETSKTIKIGWNNVRPWLQFSQYYAGSKLLSTQPDINGVLSIEVLSELVSPNLAGVITIYTFVRGCPETRFQGPTLEYANNFIGNSPEPNQVLGSNSATGMSTIGDVCEIAGNSMPNDNLNKVTFGEEIRSVKALAYRYVPVISYEGTPLLNRSNHFFISTPTHVPPRRDLGYTVQRWTFGSWFGQAFLIRKGGTRWKLSPFLATGTADNHKVTSVSIFDNNYAANCFNYAIGSSALLTRTATELRDLFDPSGTAQQIFGPDSSPNYEIPDYFCRLFDVANPLATWYNNPLPQNPVVITHFIPEEPTLSATTWTIMAHAAEADDFSLHFYTGAPVIKNP